MLREQTFAATVPSCSSGAHHRANSSVSWSDLATAPVVTCSAIAVTSSNAIAATNAPITLSNTTTPDSPDLMLRTNGVQASFPFKLQRILDKLEAEGNHEIISWLPHGRAFVVHDPDRFVSDLMTVYFK